MAGSLTPDASGEVVYMDQMEYTNDKGEVVELKVPRVEYVVMPEKID